MANQPRKCNSSLSFAVAISGRAFGAASEGSVVTLALWLSQCLEPFLRCRIVGLPALFKLRPATCSWPHAADAEDRHRTLHTPAWITVPGAA